MTSGNGTLPEPPRRARSILARTGIRFGDVLGWGVGLVIGAGGLFDAYYRFAVWGWISLAAMLCLLGTLATRRQLPPGRASLLAAALGVFAILHFASALWAESVGQAFVEAHRWAFYAVLLALLTMLAERKSTRIALVIGVTSGISVVGGFETIRLLGAGASEDFVQGRLDEPVGYFNGVAALLLLGAWLFIGVAEGSASRLLAGTGAMLGTGLTLMSLLTQSRGAVAALAGSSLAVLALLPGRRRRGVLFLIVASAAVLAWQSINDVYETFDTAGGEAQGGAVREALSTIGILALGCGLVWAVLSPATGWLEGARLPRRAGRAVAVVAAGVCAVALSLAGPSLMDSLEERWTDFKTLETPQETSSRLASASGTRYDLWRIALGEFRDHPVAGVGAGNYDTAYFRERRTVEDVRQPHSIVFQTAAELGLPGLAALIAFATAAFLLIVRIRTRVLSLGPDRGLAVGAAGCLLFWLIHSSVDWIQLLPAVTGTAIVAMAVLAGVLGGRGSLSLALPVRLAIFGAILIAAVNVGTMLLGHRAAERAQASLASDPKRAIQLAADAIELNDESLEAYYALAAAQARLNRYFDARDTLLEAARREPSDFIPQALLGDLAFRRGDSALATLHYERARELNPRDLSIRELVRRARARTPRR